MEGLFPALRQELGLAELDQSDAWKIESTNQNLSSGSFDSNKNGRTEPGKKGGGDQEKPSEDTPKCSDTFNEDTILNDNSMNKAFMDNKLSSTSDVLSKHDRDISISISKTSASMQSSIDEEALKEKEVSVTKENNSAVEKSARDKPKEIPAVREKPSEMPAAEEEHHIPSVRVSSAALAEAALTIPVCAAPFLSVQEATDDEVVSKPRYSSVILFSLNSLLLYRTERAIGTCIDLNVKTKDDMRSF